ncbi:ABC transporter ATP-binding protein [Pseudoalteromonas sp. S1610]|uniref:ABC transporter ATP-binding protein n=1 Tax=unclassified Pseudoalteromonas TaxID=194690 RepID=UPI00110C0276|nr:MULTISPECIES: ABC transporter ATP-binding protein [unclassified Pseudoalteromonas]MCK8128268.1 ABC transporter ATP-binding protein [Pseudoalteromonas sp. 2CM39R]TMP59150.1 ABC transporter ATP-binding protein [Pseudoalteromonas sp. S1610]
MTEPLIKFENVVFRYASNTKNTLEDINFTIDDGEYISITGTSGSGKSTLLSILGLMNKPSQGNYSISGIDTQNLTNNSLAAIKNREIGFIFQNFNLLSHLTVFDNVALPLTYNNSVKRNEYKAKVQAVLKQVSMEGFINKKPNQLSGGQQQRVAIARALINKPSLILADEPTGNLDSNNSQLVYELLEKLNILHGNTICLITHDENYAKKAKRRLHIHDGKLID